MNTFAEQAVTILTGVKDFPETIEQTEAWLAELGVPATFTDFDTHTTGWTFTDGSVADEEIHGHWNTADSMMCDLGNATC
jgi:hypothetical protein